MPVEFDVKDKVPSSGIFHQNIIMAESTKQSSFAGINVDDNKEKSEIGAEESETIEKGKLENNDVPEKGNVDTISEQTNLKSEKNKSDKGKFKKEGKHNPESKKEKKKKRDTSIEKIESLHDLIVKSELLSTGADEECFKQDYKEYSGPTCEDVKDQLFPVIGKYSEAEADVDIFTMLPAKYDKNNVIDEVCN